VTEPADLAQALRSALESQRPAVVDVVTSGRITFRDVTSELMLPRQAVV
jgi:thiamine pyrophosphate-dependent acetolactate synthase large subunit-like protein